MNIPEITAQISLGHPHLMHCPLEIVDPPKLVGRVPASSLSCMRSSAEHLRQSVHDIGVGSSVAGQDRSLFGQAGPYSNSKRQAKMKCPAPQASLAVVLGVGSGVPAAAGHGGTNKIAFL